MLNVADIVDQGNLSASLSALKGLGVLSGVAGSNDSGELAREASVIEDTVRLSLSRSRDDRRPSSGRP